LVVKMASGAGVALGVGVGVIVGVIEGVDVCVGEGVIEGVEVLVGARVGMGVSEAMIVGTGWVEVRVVLATDGAILLPQAARRLVDRKRNQKMRGKRG